MEPRGGPPNVLTRVKCGTASPLARHVLRKPGSARRRDRTGGARVHVQRIFSSPTRRRGTPGVTHTGAGSELVRRCVRLGTPVRGAPLRKDATSSAAPRAGRDGPVGATFLFSCPEGEEQKTNFLNGGRRDNSNKFQRTGHNRGPLNYAEVPAIIKFGPQGKLSGKILL